MEKKINLSEQDKINKRLDIDQWKDALRGMEQTKELMEKDLADDMPSKRLRWQIRKNNVDIEAKKWDIKATEKMLRNGEQTIEEPTPEELKKFTEKSVVK